MSPKEQWLELCLSGHIVGIPKGKSSNVTNYSEIQNNDGHFYCISSPGGVCVCLGGGIRGHFKDSSSQGIEFTDLICLVSVLLLCIKGLLLQSKKRYHKKIVSVQELVQDSPWTVVLKVLWVFK